MIIDEKGRLFGKVSIVDIAVVLFVIVVAAVLVWRFAGPEDTAKKVQEITCSYECVVDGIRIESVNALKENIGKDVFDTQGNKIGTLVSVEETAYKSELVTNNGNVILVEVPEKYSANIVFEGECKKGSCGTMRARYR